jgi:hypothetical protein
MVAGGAGTLVKRGIELYVSLLAAKGTEVFRTCPYCLPPNWHYVPVSIKSLSYHRVLFFASLYLQVAAVGQASRPVERRLIAG